MDQFRRDLELVKFETLDKGLRAAAKSAEVFGKELDKLRDEIGELRTDRERAEEGKRAAERKIAFARGGLPGPKEPGGRRLRNPVTGDEFRVKLGDPLADVSQGQLDIVRDLAEKVRTPFSSLGQTARTRLGIGFRDPNVIAGLTDEQRTSQRARRRELLIDGIAAQLAIDGESDAQRAATRERVARIMDSLKIGLDFHKGGFVGGRGTVRANLLSGEFVTNRQATAQNPAALSAINAGVKLDEKFDEMIGKLNELNNTFNDAFSGTSANALTVKPVAGSEGTQEVSVDTTVTHRDLNVRFVNAGVFADEAISEPIKKLMVAQVGEEIRKVADNLGILRDATSNTNRPIGQS